jgi:trehalose 6-phosphate phosphatase
LNLLEHTDELAGLLDGRLGLFVDFDGTISHLAPTPDEAVISLDAADALRRLHGTLALVCVISGRGVSNLRGKVGVDGLVYVGNHGGERYEAGKLVADPGMAEYEERIAGLMSALRGRLESPGIVWENKRYSAAVHFRATEDPRGVKKALAEAVSEVDEVSGLEVFWGKMILEIRAPNAVHKGDALRQLVREHRLDAAVFLGDDMTDLDAMKTLRDLREHNGLRGISAVVIDESTPEELLRAADYTLDGVTSVETLLDWLWRASRGEITTETTENTE